MDKQSCPTDIYTCICRCIQTGGQLDRQDTMGKFQMGKQFWWTDRQVFVDNVDVYKPMDSQTGKVKWVDFRLTNRLGRHVSILQMYTKGGQIYRRNGTISDGQKDWRYF